MPESSPKEIVQEMQKASQKYQEHIEKEQGKLLRKEIKKYLDNEIKELKKTLPKAMREGKQMKGAHLALVETLSKEEKEKIRDNQKRFEKLKSQRIQIETVPTGLIDINTQHTRYAGKMDLNEEEFKKLFYQKKTQPALHDLQAKYEVISTLNKKLADIKSGMTWKGTKKLENLEGLYRSHKRTLEMRRGPGAKIWYLLDKLFDRLKWQKLGVTGAKLSNQFSSFFQKHGKIRQERFKPVRDVLQIEKDKKLKS